MWGRQYCLQNTDTKKPLRGSVSLRSPKYFLSGNILSELRSQASEGIALASSTPEMF